ncbi:TPR repeat-containing protein [Algoriphagus boritolerans DSM 17298 = JCM 18970]|uniref:TPR repeat-containing protein n=2 Tax=Algoriphagus TaxID=246875 RepID=A0A1H5TRT9_9BACT|nr:TPR repeat-containing protein [Algoriphagus boritolerans DSM 17298 = JCM 18970]
MVLIGATTLAFGQKKVLREAEKGFKSGDLQTALTAIDAASTNPETSGDPATHLLKAKIETKIFYADSSNTMETVQLGSAALGTFKKAFDMAGGDKAAGVGKEIYEDDLPGVPDNLRPYSIYTLKNIAFDKGIERYSDDDFEMAYEFFNMAGEIDLSDTTIHYNAGFLANDLGKFEDAKRHFGYLLDVPEYNKLNAYYFMVQILSTEEKNPEAAYELVTKAKEEYPMDKVLAEYEIQLLLQLNKMDEAMSQINEALANDPNNTGLLLRSGYLKEQAGDLDGALVDYKKSVEVDPNFFQGNFYTGALLLEQATKMLNALNELSDAEWEKQSEVVGKKADEIYKDAGTYFEQALKIQPENTDPMTILFQIYSKLKMTEQAEAMNKKLVEKLGPNWMDN